MLAGTVLSTSLRTDLAMDALNMGLWIRATTGTKPAPCAPLRPRCSGRAILDTERLADALVVASVGSEGDCLRERHGEAFNSLSMAELVRSRGPWTSIDDLKIAVAE